MLLTALLLGLPRAATADRQEWHLSPVGILGASFVEQAGRTQSSFAGGAGLRAAYGPANMFELGLQAHFTASPTLFFSAVTIGGQPGTLATDVYTVELAFDARLVLGVSASRAFSRLHPLFGVRAGGLVRIFTSRLLLDESGQLIFRMGDDASVLPALTGYAGAEYRFARSWLVGLVGAFTYAGPGYYAASATVELSWMTYGAR